MSRRSRGAMGLDVVVVQPENQTTEAGGATDAGSGGRTRPGRWLSGVLQARSRWGRTRSGRDGRHGRGRPILPRPAAVLPPVRRRAPSGIALFNGRALPSLAPTLPLGRQSWSNGPATGPDRTARTPIRRTDRERTSPQRKHVEVAAAGRTRLGLPRTGISR